MKKMMKIADVKRWRDTPLYYVDLQDDWDILPDGWHFVLDANSYTGWTDGHGSVRFACVEWESAVNDELN